MVVFGRFGVELSGLGRGLVWSYQVSAFLVELELGRKDFIFKKKISTPLEPCISVDGAFNDFSDSKQ